MDNKHELSRKRIQNAWIAYMTEEAKESGYNNTEARKLLRIHGDLCREHETTFGEAYRGH